MPNAVDSVMDVVAPPPRASSDPSRADDGPSFDEHLDANDTPRPDRPARTERPERSHRPEHAHAQKAEAASQKSDARADDDKTQATPAQQQSAQQNNQTPANPITLQIVDAAADAATANTDAQSANEDEAPAQTPQQIAPVLPATTGVTQTGKPHNAKARGAETGNAKAAGAKGAAHGAQKQAAPALAPQATPPKTNAAPVAPAQSHEESAPHQAESQIAQAAPQSETPQQTPALQAPPAPPSQHTAQAAATAPAPAAPQASNAKSNHRSEKIADVSNAPHASTAPQQQAPTSGVEARAARQDAAQQSAPPAGSGNTTPTAAPRDTFTALLAQQESASAPAPTSATPAPLSAAPAVGATSATSASAAAQAASAAAPATQVSREIVRRFNGQSTRIEVRLDPPELGRVEVKLDVSRDHKVTATIAADSPQALNELARHARDLQDALQSAGLDLSEGGLSFDLSQQRDNLADAREQRAAAGERGNQTNQNSAQQDVAPAPTRALTLDSWRGVRVDLVA